MAYHGLFNGMDNKHESPASVIIISDDEGVVTGYEGPDMYWLLGDAVRNETHVLDVMRGYPSGLTFHAVDASGNYLDPALSDDPDLTPNYWFLISKDETPVAVVRAPFYGSRSVSIARARAAVGEDFDLLLSLAESSEPDGPRSIGLFPSPNDYARAFRRPARGTCRAIRESEARAYLDELSEAFEPELVQEILDISGGRNQLVLNGDGIHPALRGLFQGLAREDGFVDGGPGWISFNSDDAYIEAEVKRGAEPFRIVRIDAYLLSTNDARPSEDEVRAWIEGQPRPVLGMLQVGSRDPEDDTIEYLPLLSLDVAIDSIVCDFVRELVFPFAEAWDGRSVATGTEHLEFGPDGRPYHQQNPVELRPRNAWLLMGDEASYPGPEELAEVAAKGEAGIFDYDWTAPKNGERGDLVLIYFVAPKKSACFIARLASRPYWDDDLVVNAVGPVNRHQWWAYLTPPVEIEPIPFRALQEAHHGYLALKGRSGHYLLPDAIAALTFTAHDPSQQEEVDRIAQVPTGNPDLPGQIRDLDEWKAIPSGALPLEAKVSEHIVRPLGDLVYGPGWEWTLLDQEPRIEPTIGPILVPEHRVPSGFVDFVFMYPISRPALAVEVKLTVLRPASGVWADSRDFQQLRRYMDDLDVPGLLVDAQWLLLVRRGADAPFAEVVRSDATWDDIAMVRDLLLGGEAAMPRVVRQASPRRPVRG